MKFTKETLMKTLRTFIQTAAGYIIVGLIAFDTAELEDWRTSVIGLCISGIAAGLAAVMNLKTPSTDDSTEVDNDDDIDETEGVG